MITAAPTASPISSLAPSDSGSPTATLPPVAIGGGSGAGSSPDPLGAGSLGSPGGSGGSSPAIILALVLVAFTVGGAFAILAARRRRPQDEEQPLATAAAAAATTAAVTAQAAARAAPMDESIEEGSIPRWRRPSLRAARSASDRGPAGPTYQLAFNAAGIEGSERRIVRYRVVRMMDGPDEIRSQEVGQLEENDQVEVLGRYAGYLQVRTPVGTVGWVHRTTLGPPIGSVEADAAAGPPEFDLEAAFDMQRARTAAPGPTPAPVAAPPEPTRTKSPKKSSEKAPRRRSPKAEPST